MFHGSIVAIVTPMHANGEIDFPSLQKLIDWHLANGTDGIVVIGTTGEAPTLSFEEQKSVIQAVVHQTQERIPVIAGTGTNCTHKTIELTRMAMEVGADACLIVTPYYNRPTQEGLYQHYRAIAEAVPIPQLMYNVPSRTGCEILPETVARMINFGNIIGIKEGRVDRAKQILALCQGKIDVFSADDSTGLEIIKVGGKGIISVTANVAPKAMHELCQAALAGNIAQAQKINEKLLPLHENLFVETNPIPVKWALQEMRLISSGIRLPLTPLAEMAQPRVRDALMQAGVIIATQ